MARTRFGTRETLIVVAALALLGFGLAAGGLMCEPSLVALHSAFLAANFLGVFR